MYFKTPTAAQWTGAFCRRAQDTFAKHIAWEGVKLLGFDYRALGRKSHQEWPGWWSFCQVVFLPVGIYRNNRCPLSLRIGPECYLKFLLRRQSWALEGFSGEGGGVLGIKGIRREGEARFGGGELREGSGDPKDPEGQGQGDGVRGHV